LSRTLTPGELERQLSDRLAIIDQDLAFRTASRRWGWLPRRRSRTENARRRTSRATWVALAALGASALFATSIFGSVPDTGAFSIEVTDNHNACASGTTNAGAIVTYLSQNNACGNIGASGTGIFESFERLEASGSEEGFNTDTDKVLDNVDGTWTHSILISDIPIVEQGGKQYWELFSDVNESNGGTSGQLSLNDVEVYFSDDGGLTDLTTADLQYDFEGSILINDVNSGSGRADLRYLIPVANITIPTDCSFKNPSCAEYFVLYSKWGTTSNYGTDSGFEEWKVKNYPYVVVSKTADTTYTRTFGWTIDKSVDPDSWNLFTGDTGNSQYTVSVTKDAGADSDFAVSGTITIDNPGTLDAVIDSAADVADELSDGTIADVDCGVTFPYTIAAGDSLECSYTAAPSDTTSDSNTATVTLSAGTAFTGSAAVTWGSPTTKVHDTINVTDTFKGSLGSFSATGSTTYERKFSCDDEGKNDNTATITETGQEASASVTVTCYDLTVTKDAATGLTRKYTWGIDKSSTDPADLTLKPGESFLYHYSVTVDVTGHTDSAFGATGNIHVHNPAPMSAEINSVSDAISGGITATVDCGSVTFPYTLAAGGTLDCTYSADLPDNAVRTNTATATLQNYDYDFADPPAKGGTTDFTGTASVDPSKATVTSVDECIDVTDTFKGALGTVCVGDTLPATFTYTRTISATADDCAGIVVDNTATFTTNDTKATGHDDWEVTVTVPCETGCTLTQGYWKTHSTYGPAKKADPTWDLVGGPDAPFFLSGKSWYQVFLTPPKGNAYYILAHQYEAAKLNILGGAGTTTAVDDAMTWAETFFSTYTPTNWPKGLKNQIVQNAGVLGSYNEGTIGPGHCDEDSLAAAGNLSG